VHGGGIIAVGRDAPIGVRPDLVSDPGSAATFAAAIAAATLAFVAVVFATTLVAIQRPSVSPLTLIFLF
jgi:hypothetical protein